ncbi:hypothetical protein Pyn_08257 [Prunus yedoensis var. nudiflora]|uniref:Uncharacterized protein n=1 Tax=Prunus yedoensis var. nudiflora TaxID=2094558 RepID=A0A314Z3T7_PRUYE|nr:hypothetical protein Pyn_08257 [Prunus yedoensis var. nudiflora]
MPSKTEAQLGSHTQDKKKNIPLFQTKEAGSLSWATIITNPNLVELVDLVDLVDGGTAYGNWSKPKNR